MEIVKICFWPSKTERQGVLFLIVNGQEEGLELARRKAKSKNQEQKKKDSGYKFFRKRRLNSPRTPVEENQETYFKERN